MDCINKEKDLENEMEEIDRKYIHKRSNIRDYQTTINGDRLKRKKLPRKYKNPIRISTQDLICPYPFNIDFYDNCSYKCRYCFARMLQKTLMQAHFNKGWRPKLIRPAKMSIILKHFEKGLGIRDWKGCRGNVVKAIEHKMPVHISNMAESLQPLEKKKGLFLSWLKWNRDNADYPFFFSTKSTLPLDPVYFKELMKQEEFAVQITITTDDDILGAKLEPNAPLPSERLRMAKGFAELGIPVFIRIVPVIPVITMFGVPDLVKRLIDYGVSNIQFQILNLETTKSMADKLERIFGVNLTKYYDNFPDSITIRNSKRLSPSFVKTFYMDLINEVKDNLSRNEFKTTFCFNEGNSKLLSGTKTCCGVDKLGGNFDNMYKMNLTYITAFAKEKGNICISDFVDTFSFGKKYTKRFKDQWKYYGSMPYFTKVGTDSDGLPVFKLDYNNPVIWSKEDKITTVSDPIHPVKERVIYRVKETLKEAYNYLLLWRVNRETKIRILSKYMNKQWAELNIDFEKGYGIDSTKIGGGKERPLNEIVNKKGIREKQKLELKNGKEDKKSKKKKNKIQYDSVLNFLGGKD